jgi:hypothetical protein
MAAIAPATPAPASPIPTWVAAAIPTTPALWHKASKPPDRNVYCRNELVVLIKNSNYFLIMINCFRQLNKPTSIKFYGNYSILQIYQYLCILRTNVCILCHMSHDFSKM